MAVDPLPPVDRAAPAAAVQRLLSVAVASRTHSLERIAAVQGASGPSRPVAGFEVLLTFPARQHVGPDECLLTDNAK